MGGSQSSLVSLGFGFCELLHKTGNFNGTLDVSPAREDCTGHVSWPWLHVFTKNTLLVIISIPKVLLFKIAKQER